MININRLNLTSELRLYSSPTKYQSDWVYGVYSCRSACMDYQVCLLFCLEVCLCIALPSTFNFGGGKMKGVLHNISPKPHN